MYNTLLRSILFNRAVTQEVAALLESVDVQLRKKESLHAYIVANHIIPCSSIVSGHGISRVCMNFPITF